MDDWRANSPTSVTLKARFHCTPRLEPHMIEERKFAILFAATLMCARKLMEIEEKPSPVRMTTVDKSDAAMIESTPCETGT